MQHRVVIYTAMLGFKNKRKETLSSPDQGAAIRSELFSKDPCFEGILNLMMLLENNDSNLLAETEENDNQKIELFEEYANGGLAIMQGKLDTSNYSLDSVVSFLAEEIHENSQSADDLSDLAERI